MDCREPVDGDSTLCVGCTEKRRLYRHQPEHRQAVLESERLRRRRLKLEVFEQYGGAFCACCTEERPEFLSIDHLNNDGAAHRAEIAPEKYKGTGSGAKMYEWLRANSYPPGFQVLCMNCNFAKGHFGECPHEKERQEALRLAA